MNVLGISGSTHDSTAAVVIDGEVTAVIEQERLSRQKHAPHRLPIEAAQEALKQSRLQPGNINCVAFFLDPFVFEMDVVSHVLRTDWRRYLCHPMDYRTPLFLSRGRRYRREASAVMRALGIKAPLEFVEHHLAHAALAFWGSSFSDAMVLTIDNMGELDSTMLIHGVGANLKVLRTTRIPHSLGMFYGAITDFLGFYPWNDEGKVMALAAFGSPLLDLCDVIEVSDGSFEFKEPFQMHQTFRRKHCYKPSLKKVFGVPRLPHEKLTQHHADIAATAQWVAEETAKRLVRWMHKRTGCSDLCLAGGVAQNCKLNGALFQIPEVKRVYVPPLPGDSGAAVGAALFVWASAVGRRPQPINTASLGRSFSDTEVRSTIAKSGLKWKTASNIHVEAASLLNEFEVIAFYQGRSEAGPRALGNRSILALPQSASIKDYINRELKYRENWQPFGPAILAASADDFFPGSSQSYFMNIAHTATVSAAKRLPAVVHIDQSVRPQAVQQTANPHLAALLKEVEKQTGVPVLLNTSYNCQGEPIVDSPVDALRTFATMPLKYLVMENYVVSKE